ncbi:MAG: hypothetical protein WCP60_10395 [bacterium]
MNGRSHRNLISLFCLLAALLAPALTAQQAAPDAGFVAPRPTRPKVETTPVEKPAPFDITGIVAQAFNMRRPLQMINPLAPARYGDGSESVSWDPDKPEKPKGIILFGIQW